ncbi:MtrAB system histidine kinase MtrB [Streptomyces hirsutus]
MSGDSAASGSGRPGTARSGLPAAPPADTEGSARAARDPLGPLSAAVTPTADPTALPGNGARVVPRPAAGAPPRGEPAGPAAGDAAPAGAEADAGGGGTAGAGDVDELDELDELDGLDDVDGLEGLDGLGDRQGEASRGR